MQEGDPTVMATASVGKGLEGIVAANSGICWIDGEAGVLSYRGIDIHELAEHSTFEETTYLLWNGILPNELALREFQAQLALARSLDQRIIQMLRSFPHTATPMEVLRTAVSALSFYDADGGAANGSERAELLRRGRKRQLARLECAQVLPPDGADGHDCGDL